MKLYGKQKGRKIGFIFYVEIIYNGYNYKEKCKLTIVLLRQLESITKKYWRPSLFLIKNSIQCKSKIHCRMFLHCEVELSC